MKIAILGGTGDEGRGLAYRWANAGHEIIIGSRKAEKAQVAADELNGMLDSKLVSGMDNLAASDSAELVILSVPYSAQEPTLATIKDALAGKILCTVVVPLGKPVARFNRLPSNLSAAEEAQEQLGEDVRVVAAFQNISAHHLMDLSHVIECDVLICGAKAVDKQVIIDLCTDADMRGVNAGGLGNATIVEGLTSLLIGINIRNKIKDAGIRITGID